LTGGGQTSRNAAESAVAAVVAAKSSDATRNSELVASDSRDSGSPRVPESGTGDNSSGAATGGDETAPAATEPDAPQQHQQPPPQQPVGGDHTHQTDQNNPPPDGGHQQPAPPPPPPPTGDAPTDGDGHYYLGQGGTAQQPQPTDAYDGDDYGSGVFADLTLAD
jgi:hypothetical protein